MRRSREDKVSVGFVDDEGNIVSLGKIGKSSNETRGVYSTGLGNKNSRSAREKKKI
jgi:hypothetical protein